MSKKDVASDAVAAALAGIIAITPVPAGSTANSVPDALNQTTPITEMASINRSPMTFPPGVELPADINPGQATTQPAQQQPIRYMDLTSRADGWGASQLAAAQASRNNKVVIISYLDSTTTRALYDAAVPFTQAPTNLPIVGLIRAPAAPSNVTATPNPLGFDVFFNGSAIPAMERPDPRFTRTDQLSAFMRGIHRNYFAVTAATINTPDTRIAANTSGSGKSSSGSGTGSATGSAGGKSGGASGDLASINFNPEF